jgi:hypothetical protein
MAMNQPRTCGATFDPVESAGGPSALVWPLTITKPTGGTIVGPGDILCGTLGSTCSANVPDGERVSLRFDTTPGHMFLQFTGDCAANGDVTMTAARTCSATFTPTSAPQADSRPVAPDPQRPQKPSPPRGNPEPKPGPTGNTPQASPGATPGTSQAPTGPTGPTAPQTPPGTQGPPTGTAPEQIPTDPGGKPAPPPITPEAHAQKEIEQLVNQYCLELETLQPDRIRKIFPLADRTTLRNRFKEYKSLRCTVTPPKFDRLDASPAGGAQVKTEMKQVIEMKSGGAPTTQETVVTIVVSRMALRSPWLIDRVEHVAKPKP